MNRKTKVTIIHCGFIYSGGGERIVLEEARGLKKRGYDVEVYAPTVDYENCFPDIMKEVEVRELLPTFLDNLPYRNAFRMLITSLLAPFFAFKFRNSDFFIGANQPGAWLAFCISKVLKKPYLVYLNQPNRIVYPRPVDVEYGWSTTVSDYHVLFMVFQYLKPVLMMLDRFSVRLANVVMANGDYIKNVIENVYSHTVIDNPSGSYVYELGAKSKKYILITNRHDPQKRFDYVIEAFSMIHNQVKNVKLVIPGPSTDHTRKLKNLIKKLKIEHKVLFLGKIPEKKLQELYKYAWVYCYPSPEEDFGLGPLEAGAWGIPTVAWNHGGPTVTVDDGVSGFLAEPYDVKDYADKILKLLKDKKLRDTMGRAAYKRTKNHFTWDKHNDALDEEIKKFVK